jgi:hypothetical protein
VRQGQEVGASAFDVDARFLSGVFLPLGELSTRYWGKMSQGLLISIVANRP